MLLSCFNVGSMIVHVLVSYLLLKRIFWSWFSHNVNNGFYHKLRIKSWHPLLFDSCCTDFSRFSIDIWMINLCNEMDLKSIITIGTYLWWLERIVITEINFYLEFSALKGRILLFMLQIQILQVLG